LNPFREPRFDAISLPVNSEGVMVHALHRWTAAAAALAVIAAAIAFLRNGRRRAGLALLVVVGTQLALGLLLVHNGLPLAALAVAHNVIAALLLAVLVGVD
jgi:heme A synthase